MKTPTIFPFLLIVLICTDAIAEKDIHDEIKELEATLIVLGEELKATEALGEAITKRDEQKIEAEIEFFETEKEIVAIEKLRNIYRSAFRVVSSVSPGTPIETLTLKDGTTIEGATFSGASFRGLELKSPSGPKTIAPELLPDNVRQAFAFPPEEVETRQSIADLVANRPDFLEVEDPEPKEVSQPETGVAEVALAPAAGAAPVTGEQAVPLSERDSIAARNRERFNEINKLSTRISELRRQKNRVFRERGSKMSELRQASIRKAPREVEKILEPYNEQIAEFEDEEERLRTAISDIRLEWE